MGFNITDLETGRIIKDEMALSEFMLTYDGRLLKFDIDCGRVEDLFNAMDVSDRYKPNMKVGCG